MNKKGKNIFNLVKNAETLGAVHTGSSIGRKNAIIAFICDINKKQSNRIIVSC